MSRRLSRCPQCHDEKIPYCKHHGVLSVYVDDKTAVMVRGATEESARRTADRVRIAFRGAPFKKCFDEPDGAGVTVTG